MKTRIALAIALTCSLTACSDSDRRNATIQRMHTIHSASEMYEAEYGTLSIADDSLFFAALTGNNPKKIKFVSKAPHEVDKFLDGWNNPIIIRRQTDSRISLYSTGANGTMDSGSNSDDIFLIQK